MVSKTIFTVALLAFSLHSYAQQQAAISIIPKPVKVETNNIPVILNTASSIHFDTALEKQAHYLQQQLSHQCGINLNLSSNKGSFIVLRLGNGLNKPESYLLRTVKDSVLIEGADIKGVVNGIQTLLQLLPLYTVKAVTVPGICITDYPAFPYRGMHLDVVRHFFPVDYTKSILIISPFTNTIAFTGTLPTTRAGASKCSVTKSSMRSVAGGMLH